MLVDIHHELLCFLDPTKAFNSSSDGTTNKSKNHESPHINLHAPATYATPNNEETQQTTRFMGVRLEADHRTETQIKGDLASFNEKIELFNRAPPSSLIHTADPLENKPFTMRQLFTKWAGTHGDHAADQKAKHRKLEVMKREQEAIARMEENLQASNEYNKIFTKLEKTLIESSGGLEEWESLEINVRQEKLENSMEDILHDMALSEQAETSDDDLRDASVFLWTGCQMHKEMNAVKGGCAAMKEAWKKLDKKPIPLANRDNAPILAALNNGSC